MRPFLNEMKISHASSWKSTSPCTSDMLIIYINRAVSFIHRHHNLEVPLLCSSCLSFQPFRSLPSPCINHTLFIMDPPTEPTSQHSHCTHTACWPRFAHPTWAPILSIILILLLISLLLYHLSQLLHARLTRRRTHVHVTGTPTGTARSTYTSFSYKPPASPTLDLPVVSQLQADHQVQQLLFPATTERLPLYNTRTPRGSLYHTFQIPAPHTMRLKNSRSMVEFNGGNPLDPGVDKKKKSKTIHWHGVNRLNTAWAWMS